MALLEIVNYEGQEMSFDFFRGNIGIIGDMQSSNDVDELSAVLGGGTGNIFIMSE